jgi:hypothetical protein
MRAVVGLLGLGVVVFNVALMLSDRAPGVLRRLFGDVVDRLSDRIDQAPRIPADQLPSNDAIVHIAVWGAATALVGLTIWTWRGLAGAAAGVLALSLAVEVGQGVYSTSRSVEMSDALANAAGVALGTLGAALGFVLWSAGSVLFGRSGGRRGSDPS